MELTDQTALVTGRTAGIGLACTRLLAREGTPVIITGRDAQRGKCAVARINGAVRFIQTDLSDIESVKSLVTQAGDVDILVNNAASFPSATTIQQEITSYEKTFDASREFHHRLNTARRWRRQCHLKSQQKPQPREE
jgi:NAD(P)-dependent dehydrogenase (short-subunit alcohol dehydrogenase family)